jgi:molybdopterin-guanine dinucleotide biosynthesis protein A
MGCDKGLLDFGGVPLIVHTARVIKPLVACVTVVGAPRRFAATGLRAIADQGLADHGSRGIQRGPLAGIAAALAETRLPWNLIVACDLPYLSAVWLDWLLSRAIRSRGEVVIPRTGRGLEPLAAVYRSECGAAIKAALMRGARKVTDVIKELRMDVVDRSEWRGIDPRGLVLKNMNTPRDYDAARKWWDVQRLREGHQLEQPRQARKRKSRFVVL